MKNFVRSQLSKFGYVISRTHPGGFPLDFSPSERALVEKVRPFTMTSPERIKVLADAVRYVERSNLAGAYLECGVWRGGSMMAVAYTLLDMGQRTRKLMLFDVFDSMMPAPTPIDVTITGDSVFTAHERGSKRYHRFVTRAEVEANLRSTQYPPECVELIQGPVEGTLPENAPPMIALLRLDTDWYESTKHELVHLYPRLVEGGVLIIDDYGSHEGSRRAVDEYFASRGETPLLLRMDTAGRILVKPKNAAAPERVHCE